MMREPGDARRGFAGRGKMPDKMPELCVMHPRLICSGIALDANFTPTRGCANRRTTLRLSLDEGAVELIGQRL